MKYLLLFLLSLPLSVYSQVELKILTNDDIKLSEDDLTIYGRISATTFYVNLYIQNEVNSFDSYDGAVTIIHNFIPSNTEYIFYRQEVFVDGTITYVDITHQYEFFFGMALINEECKYIVMATYRFKD